MKRYVSPFSLRSFADFLFFPAAVFYMEIVVKLFCFHKIFNRGLLYTLLFSLPIGLLISVFGSLLPKKANRVMSIVMLAVITLIFDVQTVYFKIFKTFTTLYSATGAEKVFQQFWREVLTGILHSAVPLILLSAPLVLYIIFGKHINTAPPRRAILPFFAALVIQVFAVVLTLNSNSGVLSIRYIYSEAFVPTLSVSNFGVLTTLRLDIKNLLFGSGPDGNGGVHISDGPDTSKTPDGTGNTPTPSPLPGETADPSPEPTPEPTPIEYGDNVLEIDFESLINNEKDDVLRDMHIYFSGVEPTSKNEYTGFFKGKNLIWIVGEAFSSLVVDKDITPTLYKLANEGFVFTNFYNPVWGVSTSDGEYVTLTGLIPKSGVWSFYRSGSIYMPFGMGNLLSKNDYSCRAYHNHDYKYYKRHISHPNMGYDYKGVGNGLVVKNQWPESDLEMMEVTIPEYINDRPFHTYYMTVSGHLRYTFIGNSMASKNREYVKDLPLSEPARAYLAANKELDLAMEYLLEQLEAAGIADDTVIVLSGDHYPYGLTVEEQSELAGHEIEQNFEMYKSTLIIWCGSMEEPIIVDKPCSALDILPTIANLMGIEYDSRLLMGRDIHADADPLVIFSNRSWITDLGRYNSVTDTFTPENGVTVEDGYARKILSQVNAKFKYSARILEKDYYSHVFQTSGQ